MNNSKTITINFGKNLSTAIHLLGMRNKVAADEIGISYNTLSNIINQKFPPSKESVEKIESFMARKGMDISLLYKDGQSILNARVRIEAPLSGNEKAAFRNTLVKLERLLVTLDDLKDKMELFGYFDIYTQPDANGELIDITMRRSVFLESIKRPNLAPKKLADYFLKADDKDLWGNLYYGMFPGAFAFRINYLVECLGIRLHFMPFGTEKVKTCSTSLFKNNEYVPNSVWAEPSIIINTDACDCAEKCLFATAEEFFHMIAHQDDYKMLNTNEFILENAKQRKDAECFATELFLSKENLERYINEYIGRKKKCQLSANDITKMKQRFQVSHETLLRRLDELKLCNIRKEDYINELDLYYTDLKDKVPYRNSEPDPLPLSFRGSDFFDCAILAAYSEEQIAEEEAAKLLDCSAEELSTKLSVNSKGVADILAL